MFQSMDWVHWIALILGLLLAISEALPFTDKIKSNGIFQGIISMCRAIKNALVPPAQG